MNFLKSLWRKLFGVKPGAYIEHELVDGSIYRMPVSIRPAYDPSQDENKIMNGEAESYFD